MAGLMAGLARLAIPAFAAATPLPDPQPVPSLPPIEQPDGPSTPLIVAPPGCAVPQTEQAVFIGTLLVSDAVTARFRVDQIRSGTVEGFAVNGMVDVRYGDEVRFLEPNTRYIVGAGTDPVSGVLVSRVRPAAPLFGGNDVATADDSDVECPSIEDPVRTLTMGSTSIDSGVLTPLAGAKGDLLLAIVQPFGIAFAVLVGLVALKLLIFALGRMIRDLNAPVERVRRDREHAPR